MRDILGNALRWLLRVYPLLRSAPSARPGARPLLTAPGHGERPPRPLRTSPPLRGGRAGPDPQGRSRRTCSAAPRRCFPRRRRPGRGRRLPRGQAWARTAFRRLLILLCGGLRRPPPGELLLTAAAPPSEGGGPQAGPLPPATGHGVRCSGTAAALPRPPFCRGTRRATADWQPPRRLELLLAPTRRGTAVGWRLETCAPSPRRLLLSGAHAFALRRCGRCCVSFRGCAGGSALGAFSQFDGRKSEVASARGVCCTGLRGTSCP